MSSIPVYSTLSPLIQASLSPVFLLTAIGTSLLLIDARQNRIVDRCRVLESQILAHPDASVRSKHELEFYLRRAHRIGWAAVLCTLSALSVAIVVVILFIDAQTVVQLTPLVEAVFTAAVLFYFVSLLLYLADVLQVTRALDFMRARISEVEATRAARSDGDAE